MFLAGLFGRRTAGKKYKSVLLLHSSTLGTLQQQSELRSGKKREQQNTCRQEWNINASNLYWLPVRDDWSGTDQRSTEGTTCLLTNSPHQSLRWGYVGGSRVVVSITTY